MTATDDRGALERIDGEGRVLPDYAGGCITGLWPALTHTTPWPDWLPSELQDKRAIVVLLVDGLGYLQLMDHADLAPTLAGCGPRAITTVAPSTTATALASLATGSAPGEHGLVGYRIYLGPDDGFEDPEVLNVLTWRTVNGDARARVPGRSLQPVKPFLASDTLVIANAEYEGSGFTDAYIGSARQLSMARPQEIVGAVNSAIASGERLIYAYYPELDRVGHEYGHGSEYRSELTRSDRYVAEILDALPADAGLVVTADHGQVSSSEPARLMAPAVLADTATLSGEARFRWLHARPGRAAALLEATENAHGAEAWVAGLEQVRDELWLGPYVSAAAAARLGDVAVAARGDWCFADPADPSTRLIGKHGSLTAAEMIVPLCTFVSG